MSFRFFAQTENSMWRAVAEFILRFRALLICLLIAVTIFLGWQASQVKLSYEFSKAIPTDNPKYIAYQQFQKKFGEDGNLLVIGVQTNEFFKDSFFNDYARLANEMKRQYGVIDVISVPNSIFLAKNDTTEKLQTVPVFKRKELSQQEIDSSADHFLKLSFYKGLLYNPDSKSWLMGVSINNSILNSSRRIVVVKKIIDLANDFGKKHGIEMHMSGLPLIRTLLADRVQKEMKFFLIGSVILSAIILFLFFIIILPQREYILLIEAEVAKIAKYLLAKIAKIGN